MPAKQSVSETITILSARLRSATLLEDRRAAVLGLRSFAKDFPASVASGALRCLISSLNKDGEDVDTVKVVLETLLMLFNPSEKSLEASAELALWLADEFTQRGENIALLMEFIHKSEIYSRLYSLKLLGAILAARTERTEECIYTVPFGIGRLVSVLDEQREAIRNEGVGLLISLTATSREIQKLVAFENAYERIFAIIVPDGALAEGGQTTEDCLILLANLLRANPSNQSLFRESGCIMRLTDMLVQLLDPRGQADALASWAHTQRNRNLYAFLSIIRLFIPSGVTEMSQNQNAFWRQGLSSLVLQLAFNPRFQIQLRAEALITCGDLIRKNSALQEEFAQLMVDLPVEPLPLTPHEHERSRPYAIDALLELTLNLHDQSSFDLRFAACECLKAYFSNHSQVRLHFLGRAIEGFQSGDDESSNILTVLLNFSHEGSVVDPYREWFAAVIAFHLIYDDPTAKALARRVTSGDESKGEEVVTSVQTLTSRLLAGMRRGDDPRISTGYLMLLLGWLFEDLDAVNDLLAEGTNVQSLIQLVSQPDQENTDDVVQGLSAMLLALMYEFSTKDSPMPRTTFHSIMSSRIDRESYLGRLAKFRSLPLLRDFEITPQKFSTGPAGARVDVFFDEVFVAFLKDNYSRLVRAIDRSPDLEISVISNGEERGISRELVDSLQKRLKETEQALFRAKEGSENLEQSLHREQTAHRRLQSQAAADIAKARASYEKMQNIHEKESSEFRSWQIKKDTERQETLRTLKRQLEVNHEHHNAHIILTRRTAEAEVERIRRRTDTEIEDLRATVARLEMDLVKSNESNTQELERLEAERAKVEAKHRSQNKQAEDRHGERHRELQAQLKEALHTIEQAGAKYTQIKLALDEAMKSRADTQSELDDLLIIFGDLEEKAEMYKTRLRELGHHVSEAEDDVDEDSENEDNKDI